MNAIMQWLGRLLSRPAAARAVVIAVLALMALALWKASALEKEDDVLAFLPEGNPLIAEFQQIGEDFGGLDVALVGVATTDALDPGFLARLQKVTEELEDIPEVSHVLSLTNVQDFSPDPMGGIRTGLLIDALPESDAAKAALRERVMSRDLIVGNLISPSGEAALIYCFGGYGVDQRALAARIQSVVEVGLPQAASRGDLYWGGAPFISSYIFETTEADMDRLTPWAVAAIVFIMLLAFRDWVGTALGLLTTAMGIAIAHAAMSVAGVPLNIVLGSMPIILFAIGSAYGIHILAHYYSYARELSCEDAVERVVSTTGPTVAIAGLTTAAGLVSFALMDIRPLRTFGIFTAIGILSTLALSLTFIPAVIRLVGLKGRPPGVSGLARGLVRITVSIHRARGPVGIGLALVAVAGLAMALRVDTRMDQAAFYNTGSPPQRAEAFLADHFGGAQFIQIRVDGDLSDPHALGEVAHMADALSSIDHVTSVRHIGQPVALLNQAMAGQRRIPDTPAKVGLLYGLLTGQPGLDQLVGDDHESGLVHVQIDSRTLDETEATLAAVERWVEGEALTRFSTAPADAGPGAARLRALTITRIRALLIRLGLPVPAGLSEAMSAALDQPAPPASPEVVALAVERFLRSDEALVVVSAEQARALGGALAALGPAPTEDAMGAAIAAVLEAGPDAAEVLDLSWSAGTALEEAWAAEQGAGRVRQILVALAPLGVNAPPEDGARLRTGLADAMAAADVERVAVADPAGEGALSYAVSGLPVMHRGLSQSVTSNQLRSLGFALGLVAVILSIAFKSPIAGALATAPTAVTLAVIYGGMGLLGVHLDIGTSMLASLIIGAGVDYAVHLLSAWYAAPSEAVERGAARAAARTGTAIWTNALMVAAGFFVLTLGDARPLRNVGGLTAAAMITAAVATFLTIPALARRRRYRLEVEESQPADALA